MAPELRQQVRRRQAPPVEVSRLAVAWSQFRRAYGILTLMAGCVDCWPCPREQDDEKKRRSGRVREEHACFTSSESKQILHE